MQISVEELRAMVMDYFGTAMTAGNPMAAVELAEAQRAAPDKLVEIARKIGLIQ